MVGYDDQCQLEITHDDWPITALTYKVVLKWQSTGWIARFISAVCIFVISTTLLRRRLVRVVFLLIRSVQKHTHAVFQFHGNRIQSFIQAKSGQLFQPVFPQPLDHMGLQNLSQTMGPSPKERTKVCVSSSCDQVQQ